MFGQDPDLEAMSAQFAPIESGNEVDLAALSAQFEPLTEEEEAQVQAYYAAPEIAAPIAPTKALTIAQPIASAHAPAAMAVTGFDFKAYFEKYKIPIIGAILLIGMYFYMQQKSPKTATASNPKGRKRGGKRK